MSWGEGRHNTRGFCARGGAVPVASAPVASHRGWATFRDRHLHKSPQSSAGCQRPPSPSPRARVFVGSASRHKAHSGLWGSVINARAGRGDIPPTTHTPPPRVHLPQGSWPPEGQLRISEVFHLCRTSPTRALGQMVEQETVTLPGERCGAHGHLGALVAGQAQIH